jgi:hypothetical protein
VIASYTSSVAFIDLWRERDELYGAQFADICCCAADEPQPDIAGFADAQTRLRDRVRRRRRVLHPRHADVGAGDAR